MVGERPLFTLLGFITRIKISDSVMTERGLERSAMRGGGGEDGDGIFTVFADKRQRAPKHRTGGHTSL